MEQIQVRLCEARKHGTCDSFQKKTKRKALLTATIISGCCHQMAGVSVHERVATAPASSWAPAWSTWLGASLYPWRLSCRSNSRFIKVRLSANKAQSPCCESHLVEVHLVEEKPPLCEQESLSEFHTMYFFPSGNAIGFCYPKFKVKLWKHFKWKREWKIMGLQVIQNTRFAPF